MLRLQRKYVASQFFFERALPDSRASREVTLLMELPFILGQLGYSEREARVYIALLAGGTVTVRQLARESGLQSGTVYDALQHLQKAGLIGSLQKHKKLMFFAEDPRRLVDVVEKKERSFSLLRRSIAEVLPEITSLYANGGSSDVTVKYYEGAKGIDIVLQDVVHTMSEQSDKTFRIFATSEVLTYLKDESPSFTKERIERRLFARVIKIGSVGDQQPLTEERCHDGATAYAACMMIYAQKTALISLDTSGVPSGVIVMNPETTKLHRTMFDITWDSSAPQNDVALHEQRAQVSVV